MTRGTTVTFNFVERSTSKWPRATRSVKQAKQGRDIGLASVLKGVASCITICYSAMDLPGNEDRLPPPILRRFSPPRSPAWNENAPANFPNGAVPRTRFSRWNRRLRIFEEKRFERRGRFLPRSSSRRRKWISCFGGIYRLKKKNSCGTGREKRFSLHSRLRQFQSFSLRCYEPHQSLFLRCEQLRLLLGSNLMVENEFSL